MTQAQRPITRAYALLKGLCLALAATQASPAFANTPSPAQREAAENVVGSRAGSTKPKPAAPYPLIAAGWGPEVGGGQMASRWAEDWSGMAASGPAPALKSIAVGAVSQLALSSEIRLRHVLADKAQLVPGNDFEQSQLRAVVGADLRLDPHLRVFAEIGSGQVASRRRTASANFKNAASLQQAFFEVRGHLGSMLAGALLGRQEFADGPRQLISLSDGPNLRRTWNGMRLYAHGERYRFGLFDLRATRHGRGGFDEEVDHDERLRGINASIVVSRDDGPQTFLDPFWIQSERPTLRFASQTGRDARNAYGARLWGRRERLRFDWTVARQSGRTLDERRVDAWAVFAVQSLAISESGWKPRLTSRIDLASGGGAYGDGEVRDFHPLYASSNYLGEGQFLGLSNLGLVAPGINVSPGPLSSLAFEFGYARRLDEHDAVYAGGARAYAGTQNVAGRQIGRLARLTATWAPTRHLTLRFNLEHLQAGTVLTRAGYPSGSYGYLEVNLRY